MRLYIANVYSYPVYPCLPSVCFLVNPFCIQVFFFHEL